MKKFLLSLIAATMLCVPTFAENLNEATGTVNESGKISYEWKYWNDVKTDADYSVWPNWSISYPTELDAAPTTVAINYVLKKDSAVGPVVATGAANNTLSDASRATFYTGPIAALGAGNFVMECTMTIIPAGTSDPQITTFSTEFTSEAAPEAEYNFEFKQTTEATADQVTIKYEFVEADGKEIPENAEYRFQAGIIGFTDQVSTTRTGEIVFTGLTPNTTYTLWSNNPAVTIDGKRYATNYPNWEFKTLDGPSTVPTAKITYTVTNASPTEKGKFTYSIEVENIEESNVTGYRVWLDAPGNITMGELAAKEGVIDIEVPAEGISLWAKGEVTYKDGEEIKTISTTPNDFECRFIVVANPGAIVPVITLTCSNAKAIDSKTGTVDYVITTDKPELEGVTYRIWAVTVGDRPVSDVEEVTALEGKLNLKDLESNATTELWVKAQAITADGGMSEVAQFPGEAQGWTGLTITTPEDVPSSVVNTIDVEDSEGAVYFNLQGQRVNNPAKGFYIKVTGNKVVKVIL